MNKRLGALIAGFLLMAGSLAAASDGVPCPFGPHTFPKWGKNCKKLPPQPPPNCKLGQLPCPRPGPK
jgi:hypothetical protein